MRIVSQDKRINLPMDRASITIEHVSQNWTIEADAGNIRCSYTLATYSTLEKAQIAMDWMMRRYITNSRYFEFPGDDEVGEV